MQSAAGDRLRRDAKENINLTRSGMPLALPFTPQYGAQRGATGIALLGHEHTEHTK